MNNNEIKSVKIKKIISTVTTVILIAAVIVCAYIAVQVFTKGYASFGKNSLFRVVTGSMEPEIMTGSLIITEKTDINDVKVGDVITFRSKTAEISGSLVTHRVIDKSVSENGKVLLMTQGDNNSVADVLPVDSDNYIGKVTKVMGGDSFLTNLISFFTCENGFIVCIVLPILVISGIMMQKSIRTIKKDMSELVSEIDKIKNDNSEDSDNKAVSVGLNETVTADKPMISDEEYRELCEKIKAELAAEIKEELKESDKR